MIQEKSIRGLVEMTVREMDLIRKYEKEEENTDNENLKTLYRELINKCKTRAAKYYKIANDLG